MPEGIRVVPRWQNEDRKSWGWGLQLTAYGLTGQPLPQAQLSASANRVEYRRGDVTEWYLNDERDLEQGFTLVSPQHPSSSSRESRITLDLAVSGDLTAAPSEDGNGVAFSTAEGVPVLRYGGLQAQDANGRELPVSIETDDLPALRLVVDATSARYPITVDPVVNAANWTAESNQANALYGFAVGSAGDVNGDGYDEVIVGAHDFDNGQTHEDRVYLYHRPL